MEKHTPGPWKAGKYSVNNYQIAVYGSDQTKICTLEGWNDEFLEEAEANARLIASAPKLLETIKGAKSAMQKALPFLPADNEAVYCGEWIDEINELISIIETEG